MILNGLNLTGESEIEKYRLKVLQLKKNLVLFILIILVIISRFFLNNQVFQFNFQNNHYLKLFTNITMFHAPSKACASWTVFHSSNVLLQSFGENVIRKNIICKAAFRKTLTNRKLWEHTCDNVHYLFNNEIMCFLPLESSRSSNFTLRTPKSIRNKL